MNEYHVRGFHCQECAEDLETRLNKKPEFSGIVIDYKHRNISIPEKIDMSKMKRVLAFEKIVLEPAEHEHERHENHHHHDHDHNHAHEIDFSSGEVAARNMKLVFIINIIFSLLEFIFGALFNSAAILSDAVHDLGDAVSVGLAWLFQKISTREANTKYSFGHQRFSLLGALITGGILLFGAAILIINTLPRLLNPQPINYNGMFWLAIFAIAANGYSAWLMSRGSSANESMLNLHLLEDVLGWVAVLIVSLIVRFTDWYILDPILSLAIAGFIFYNAWPMFKKTVEIFLEAVPTGVELKKIENEILNLAGVYSISHLHIWSIDGEEHAMAVTLSTEILNHEEQEELKEEIRQIVAPQNITHSTIELMADPDSLLR
ncbi:cation diffusion facilitator family transporter [Jeotgalibaca sp. A127]|uniref:cation diffusion facilitator family transporter n=1 Tax=Jeotgalibaca sp. A127 TaxID=3457324 RepID=UPI003FD38645